MVDAKQVCSKHKRTPLLKQNEMGDFWLITTSAAKAINDTRNGVFTNTSQLFRFSTEINVIKKETQMLKRNILFYLRK
jgi:hypothetical protein